MKLKYKLFIALGTTSCLILLLVVGGIQFTIRKNFIGFLNDVEFKKQTKMVELLKESYAQNSDWKKFKAGPRAWHGLLRRVRTRQDGFDRSPPGPHGTPPHGPGGPRPHTPGFTPGDPTSLHRRLCLFDEHKNYVAGVCRQDSEFDYYPIVLSERIIGYLGLENIYEMRQPLEFAFLKKQTRAVYIIGAGILVISLLVSYVISRQVLGPVNALARGTREMRRFNFGIRVNVRSNDELGALAKDFNRMAATLQQYETMRKNWISDISHELRTPVAVIRSKLEAIQDGIREMTPELLYSLHKDILGLGRLINDLHQISLMDTRNLSVNLKPVHIEVLLDKSIEVFAIPYEKKGIKIQKAWTPETIPMVSGDTALLKRVFANLLENTLKYTDAPGILKLDCRVSGPCVVIEVEDSAPAVPVQSLESIFERLYRLEQSRNKASGGSGLGLSMSREIISLHQGTITACPSSLGGLKIVIELPLTQKTNST
ncbi:MAG: ATP-binding protein [Desulfobacterales bacterium]|nr:ATP-binding protein [Desulfobacterales bacterium]